MRQDNYTSVQFFKYRTYAASHMQLPAVMLQRPLSSHPSSLVHALNSSPAKMARSIEYNGRIGRRETRELQEIYQRFSNQNPQIKY